MPIRFGLILLLAALLAGLSCDQFGEARMFPLAPHGGPAPGGGARSFTFSYPPPAHLTPVHAGEDSFPLTNSFGTFAWTNRQVEDPGGTPHEQYGMWFVTLTPAGGGAAQQLTLPNGLGAMSMAQDNLGIVYIEQGDANWYWWLAWSTQGVCSPEPPGAPGSPPLPNTCANPITPGPLDIPTVSGPFSPSADSMTPITAPTGTKTSVEGVWTWGALDTCAGCGGFNDYFLLLNGATTGFSAHTLTIESNGKAFVSQAHTGSNKVFLGYSFNSGGSPTPGPIPIGISWAPSYYSNSGICVAVSTTCAPIFSRSGGSNVPGHLMSTATVTMSDGSVSAATYSLFQIGPPNVPAAPFQLVGNQLQLSSAAPLTSAYDGATTGGPLFASVYVLQNGVTMNAGWAYINVDVGP